MPYRFSVVVPTYRRADLLRRCLTSLQRMDYPRTQFEVIVVDDGSPLSPDGIVHGFRDELNVTLLRQENAGPASARNAGLTAARGEFIALTDDDGRVERNWLLQLERRLSETPDQLVGGQLINDIPENTYSVTSHMILDAVYAHANPNPDDATFFATSNMAMRSGLIRELGGFDARFNVAGAEDRELCDRWRTAGLKMTYEPKAIVYHSGVESLRGLWRQFFNYGRGAHSYHRLNRLLGSDSFRSALTFHARLPALIRSSLFLLSLREVVAVIPLLAVWELANLTGFCHAKLFDPCGWELQTSRAGTEFGGATARADVVPMNDAGERASTS